MVHPLSVTCNKNNVIIILHYLNTSAVKHQLIYYQYP